MTDWWEKYKKDRNLGGNKKSPSERIGLKKEVRVTDENRQTAKSSTWWEDYKKKRDLNSKIASDRQRAERSQRFASANRQLEKNRSRDAAEDEIRELFRNPFSTDAEWQAGVLQRNAERYKRDLPLYQQALQNASTWGEYFSTHRQAGESQSAVKHQFERYQQAAQNAEQERNESNLVNRPAQWQAENLTPQEIEQRLAYYRSEAATPTVTDRDREEHAYLYPEAALKKVPHGARFDERLLEGAGQDAIDALYRPILTEQEKAAVEEADQQIIKEKAERNYEQVQRLLAAQKGQTEMFTRARGNELIEEIAQGGEAAKQVETGRAAFEAKQQQIASETSFEIGDDLESNRGAYNKMQKERKKRGYILGYDWDNVPEDRKQAVYALYAEDPKKAIELAKFYIADVRQAEDEERQAWYAQNGWTAALGLVSSAAAHLGATVDPFGDVGQELTRRGDNALAGGSQWADAATGYQKIPEWVPIVGGKGAGDFYQTVGSVVQSAAVAAPAILVGRYDKAAAEVVGKLGLVLMGSSAAASDYRESVAAGMDEDRAKLHALAAGVEEALFEEVSLDKLIKMDTSGGLKAALKNWLVQSGIEGSEELATSIANRFTDEMISGAGQSKVERRASELIANGMSSTEAHTQAESEWMTDTLYDGFSGFLSGGMMTGGNYALQGLANLKGRAVNAAETRKAQKQAGAAVSRSEGSVEALQAYAKDKGIEIKAVETADQNAEQGGQDANQNSYSSRDYRSISDTTSKVVQSIRSEVRGKTVQEQQTIRDNLVEKYGDGIAPVVNQAISVETAARVRQEYGNVDSIQAARNKSVSEIKDESLRRAVSDGYDSAAYSIAASQGGEGGMDTMSRYIQQRRNTGSGSEMSMNATVTAQDGSTKTIAITGMSEDGKRVSLADGSEVAVKDLQADEDTTSAIQQLADLDLGDDATKVLQAYQQSGVSGTDGYRWLMDYATAYNQGRTRQISLEQAAKRSSLDERTVMDAYTLGQQAANRETQAGLEKLKNLPKRKGASGRTANIDTTEIKGKTMSKSELEQFELANQYAQALGVDMTWFSSREKDGKFIDKNGAYENGKIYMDIHAGRNFTADLTSGILATMGHELTHFQQQYAPEEYQALKSFLFEQIVKSSPNGEARLERLIWLKQERSGYTLSRKAAEDEVVADACQKMLRDSKAVHDFASQQPEAANGIVRWLDKWFKRVRSIFGRGGNYSEEAQLMDSLEQDVKAAFGELWDKALKQAAKVHDEVGNIEKATTEGESKAQNSDRDAEYLELAKDPEKNKARLQEMVDEAAELAGYTIKAYHGTEAENRFTVFDKELRGKNHGQKIYDESEEEQRFKALSEKAFYFAIDKEYAEQYGENVMRVFLREGEQADISYREISEMNPEEIRQLLDEWKGDGIDSFYIHDYDYGNDEIGVFYSEQVKSADPITYDDQGNVIPLSERFNAKNEDIRYSERDELASDNQIHDITNRSGETVGVQDGNGHVQFSQRTWRESGKEKMQEYLDERVRKYEANRNDPEGMHPDDAKALMDAVQEQYDALDEIVRQQPGNYKTYEEWADAEVETDIFGNPVFSWLKANGDYGISGDASLICVKRRTLDAVFDYMIRENMIQDGPEGLKLAQESIVAINDIIRAHGFETACSTCYIDARRYRAAIVAGSFCNVYNKLVRSMLKGKTGVPINAFNFGGNKSVTPLANSLDTLSDSEINWDGINKAIRDQEAKWESKGWEKFTEDGEEKWRRNGTVKNLPTSGTTEYRIALALKEKPSLRKLALRSDFLSGNGFLELNRTNKDILTLYNVKKGQAGPKATETDIQYLHEALENSFITPERMFKAGGFRLQSFSDYVPRLVFDYVEIIGDLSAKGVPAHMYTKEILCVLQHGLTGTKINMSLIPAMVKKGFAPGLDADGNYLWRDGQTFGSTAYSLSPKLEAHLSKILGYQVKGRLTGAQGFELAKLIQNDPAYGKNNGTIAIGVSEAQIRKMLDDADIRMVIPYHKSGLNHILASMMEIPGFENYESYQNTLKWNGTKWAKVDVDFDFNEAVQKHKGDARAAAQDYLDWCEENGYKPKFSGVASGSARNSYNKAYDFTQHADWQTGTMTGEAESNYYKVLADFTCYDADGKVSRQEAVKLNYPGTDSTFGSMKQLIEMGLESDAMLQAKQDAEVPKIVDDIRREIPKFEAAGRNMKAYAQLKENVEGRQYSEREYLDAVDRGDMETAKRLVEEAARKAGYTVEGYHGTPDFGFTVLDVSKSDDKISFFVTSSVETARTYSGVDGTRGISEDVDQSRDLTKAVFNLISDAEKEAGVSGIIDKDNAAKGIIEAVSKVKYSYEEQNIASREINNVLEQIYDAAEIKTPFHVWLFRNYRMDSGLLTNQYDAVVSEAMLYMDRARGDINEGNYRVFIDPTNLLEIDGGGAKWNEIEFAPTNDSNGYSKTRDIAKWAKDNGYSGVLFKGIVDDGGIGRQRATKPSDVYALFKPQAQVKSADLVTYDQNGNVIPLSERFNEANEDIRFSERDNAKPRSAQAQRDAGYKLSESKFYSLYSAHKLNMTGRGNVQEQIASIMADGFKGDGGFGNNVMPTNISYDVDENGKRIPRGLSAQKYAPKKGEYILLVPKEGVEVKGGRYNFTERVKPGYKPAFDYEIVQADYDGQPYYEMYSKAYDRVKANEALSERFNEANEDIRFSMREPVEQTDRLIAWHNMNEEALRSALELGGLAMPSWAIKTADRAHTSYGEVSIIAPRNLIDPKMNRNSMIFGGDAWTPVFPEVNYKVAYESAEKLENEIKALVGEDIYRQIGGAAIDADNIANMLKNNSGGLSSHYAKNLLLRLAYLKSQGEDVQIPQKEKDLYRGNWNDAFTNEQVKKFADSFFGGFTALDRYLTMDSQELMETGDGTIRRAIAELQEAEYKEKLGADDSIFKSLKREGTFSEDAVSFSMVDNMLRAVREYYEKGVTKTVDKAALEKTIDKEIDQAAYEKWMLQKLNDTVERKGIRNNKDVFTPSGNRRSFDQLNYAFTLANIVRAMKSQPKQGRVQFLSGPGSVKGAALKSYNTVDQVRKDRGRLADSAEEGQEAYDEYNRNLEDILDRMSKNGDRFDAADALIEVFQHAKTESGIYNYMQRELKDWYNISHELAHDAYELIGQINRLPMEYFEGKTYDAVRFDETAAVVVPDNIDPALKQQLNDAGARVVEYKAGDDTDRLAKVNSVEGAQFSERDYSTPSDEELLMNARVEDAESPEARTALQNSQKQARQIRDLTRRLERLQAEIRGYEGDSPNRISVQRFRQQALDLFGIPVGVRTDMGELLQSVAEGVLAGHNLSQNDIMYFFETLITNGREKSVADETLAEIRDDLKGRKIYVNENVKAEFGDDWNAFRKRAFSLGIQLTNNEKNMGIDSVNLELAELYPGKFDAGDTDLRSILENIVDTAESGKTSNVPILDAMREIQKQTGEPVREQLQTMLDQFTRQIEIMQGQAAVERKARAGNAAEIAKARKQINEAKEALREVRKQRDAWKRKSEGADARQKRALDAALRNIVQHDAKQIAEAVRQKQALAKKLQDQIDHEKKILSGELRSPELAKLLKAEREKAEARVKEQKEQVFQNYKERKKAGDLRGRIKNLSDEMKRRMTNPTDRAYVPASLYQSMTKLADVLDNVLSPNPGTKAEARYRAMMDAIRGMAREYEDVKKLDPVFASEYDQEVIDAIGEIERILERKNASWIDNLTGDTQKSFAELNSDELQQLYDLMRQINYTIANATKVFGNLRYESIREAIASGLEQQSKITPIADVSKQESKKRLSVMNKRSPMRAVEYMSNMDRGAALYEAFQQVEAGDEQRLAWSLAYQNDFRELKSGKNEKTYWQSLTKQIDYGATDKKTGKPVTMTKMQAIQIFMTAQREAANKNLEHFFKGGATIRNANDIMEGKENIRSNEVFVTTELLKNIENSFTEWDRQYMARMRDYLKREGKAVNKVFYKLKHRVLPLEENYVPTIVDQKYLDAKLETTDFSGIFVKSPRSTQAITKGAPQPLIIDGMETMMNKHVQEQAQYIGMATAIRDFAKIFNGKASTDDNGVGYTSLKAEIERNFGKEGVHLITQALIDIQGGSTQSGWKSGLEDFLKKLQTSFVRHALLFNLSVTIKQAASYVAAGSIISREALLKGNRSILNKNEASHSASLITQIFLNPNGKTAQKIFARADKYTALHADRRNGMNFAEVELGQKNYGKLRQKAAEIGANLEQKRGGHKVREIGAALNPASWIQRMDVATTAALFVACEYQARMDGLEGEAYHAKVKELYERVLRETQPMYDSLHRTAQQKSGGSLAQYLFPFRTVPIQNHGQMASAYDRLLAAKTKSNTEKAEAAKFFRKTLIAQIESAVVFSAMTFAAALTKRKTKKYRDEDGELTLESVARGFGLDVASTLVSVASPMWGSELWSLSDRFINKFTGKGGYTYDSFSVGALDMINDTAAAIDKIAADVGKATRREDVSLKEFGTHMFSLLTKLGNLSGIPADTIKTYTEGFIGNIQDAIEGRIPALNDESWERDAATNARRYLKAYLNNDAQKASAVLAELRSNLSKSGKGEEKINEAIRKYVSAQAVEKVAAGTWTEEEAEAYLLSTGAYDDRENPQKDAWNAIRKGVAKATSTDEEFNWKQYDDLAEAVANGEDVTDLLAEYRDHGYSDDQINAAIRSGIQEALTAGDLDGNEAADALIRYGVTYSKDGKAVAYDEQTAWKKVQEWIDKAEHTDEEGELEDGYKYSAYADLFDAVDANQNADGIIQTMVQNGGYDTDGLRSQIKDHLLERFIAGQITETALKNQLSRYCKISKADDANEIVANAKCKRDFGVYPDDLKEAFKDGDLSQNQAEKALQQYKGLSKADAQNRVHYWGYDGDLSENAWAKWAHELKSTGLSVDNWEKVYKVKSSAKGTDANGDGRADSGTVKAEVVSYIDSMNIPKSQKKAIYLAFGWAASTMPNWR